MAFDQDENSLAVVDRDYARFGIRTAPGSCYMEPFMHWHLIYRDHSDLRAWAAALPEGDVADSRVFDDREDTITYLLVTKAQ